MRKSGSKIVYTCLIASSWNCAKSVASVVESMRSCSAESAEPAFAPAVLVFVDWDVISSVYNPPLLVNVRSPVPDIVPPLEDAGPPPLPTSHWLSSSDEGITATNHLQHRQRPITSRKQQQTYEFIIAFITSF